MLSCFHCYSWSPHLQPSSRCSWTIMIWALDYFKTIIAENINRIFAITINSYWFITDKLRSNRMHLKCIIVERWKPRKNKYPNLKLPISYRLPNPKCSISFPLPLIVQEPSNSNTQPKYSIPPSNTMESSIFQAPTPLKSKLPSSSPKNQDSGKARRTSLMSNIDWHSNICLIH